MRPAGTKVGDGSSPCSLSRAGIWRPKGCRLPDAILHGKRNCGLIAGPSSALRSLGFRVRPLSSLGLAFAAPACEPDKDTFVTFAPRLYHLTPGRPPLLAVRWPGVTGLTSYLSGCIWLTSQRCSFYIAGILEVKDLCPGPIPSRSACSLCLAFRRLSFGGLAEPPESCVPCWHTVATVYPLGNCDSLKLETSLSYLTRIGTASRPFSLSS